MNDDKPGNPSRTSHLTLRPSIDVSAALIFRKGKILITQRYAGAHLGGLWEFPGGKREPNESFEQCLIRELREELGVEISVGNLLESVMHAYPEKTVQIKFFICQLISGEPKPLGCPAVHWTSRWELENYEFPAADVKLIDRLLAATELWGTE